MVVSVTDNSIRAVTSDEQSIVIDVGTYKGEFTEKLLKKHDCFIHALEPVEEYYEFLQGSNEEYYKIYDIETIGHEFGHTLWLTPGCEIRM